MLFNLIAVAAFVASVYAIYLANKTRPYKHVHSFNYTTETYSEYTDLNKQPKREYPVNTGVCSECGFMVRNRIYVND